MPVRITEVDRIIARIGVTVDVDTLQHRVPGVGGEETCEVWVGVSRVQILQARLGVEAFVDIALALQGLVLRIAIGAVALRRGGLAKAQGHAVGGEMILDQKLRQAALTSHIGVERGGEQVRSTAQFSVGPQEPGGGVVEGFYHPLPIGAIDKARGQTIALYHKRAVLKVIGQSAEKLGAGTVGVRGEGVVAESKLNALSS